MMAQICKSTRESNTNQGMAAYLAYHPSHEDDLLDNHGDMVGSAGCGNGVPMWFQQKAAPDLIGKKVRSEAS